MTTVDQIGRLVLDFYGAMLSSLGADIDTGRADDLSGNGAILRRRSTPTAEWDAECLPRKGALAPLRLRPRREQCAQHGRRGQAARRTGEA